MRRAVTYLFPPLLVALFAFGYRLPKARSAPDLTDPINIYLYDTLLLVSDRDRGIHVYSVKERCAPAWLQTIPLRGNTGMAVKDSILFANSHGSLLAIRLHDDSLYTIASVLNGSRSHPGDYGDYCYGDYDYYGGFGCGCTEYATVADNAPRAAGGGGGVGGSYATFAVIDSFLYYIDGYYIKTLDITDPAHPRPLADTYVGWEIETLFPTHDHLFVGGTRGMYVLDRSDPSDPREIGRVEHFRACDPVVVRDSTAFVTLRGGTRCGEAPDTLLVVNIADPAAPKVIGGADAPSPYGLAVKDTLLYVANGTRGFTLYSVAEPAAVRKTGDWSTPPATDFIWMDSTLYTMALGHLSILHVGDPHSPREIAVIP